jgi:predicted aldo/keto reductase-like oxidoreductase
VLSNPNIDSLIISMKSKELVDQYVSCSGDSAFAASDAEVLRQYVESETADHCRTSCSSCESSCPYGVPIADVLRHRMYAESYGDMEMAREGYRELGAAASPCATCNEPPCLNACDYSLVIPTLTRATERLLRG